MGEMSDIPEIKHIWGYGELVVLVWYVYDLT